MRQTRQQYLDRLKRYWRGASCGTIRTQNYPGVLVRLDKRGNLFHLTIGGKAIETMAGQAGAQWDFALAKRELLALIRRLHPERRKPRLVKIGDLRLVQNRKQRTDIDRFLRRRLHELEGATHAGTLPPPRRMDRPHAARRHADLFGRVRNPRR